MNNSPSQLVRYSLTDSFPVLWDGSNLQSLNLLKELEYGDSQSVRAKIRCDCLTFLRRVISNPKKVF